MGKYVPTADQQAAIDVLRLAGYSVIRQRTYARLLERVRVAEALREAERDHRKDSQEWARRECDEQRRLSDRLTYVYGVARAHGASVDDLRQPEAVRDEH